MLVVRARCETGRKRTVRWIACAAVGLVAAITALTLAAQPAAAHASLVSSEPAHGDELKAPPEQVLLRFNERVDAPPDAIEVYSSSGDAVDIGPIQRIGGGSEVAVELPQLEDGAYVVSWQVVSGDSHPISGAFLFWVGDVTGEGDAEALLEELVAGGGGDRSLGVVYGIVRFAAFAGMLLLVGGALFVGVLWPGGASSPRLRRILGTSWLTLLLATIVAFGLQAAYGVGGSWGDTVDPGRIGDVLGTRSGRAWLVRLGLLAAVLFAWRQLLPRPLSRSRRPAATGGSVQAPHVGTIVVLGVALLATVSFAGHAGTGDLVPLALVADVVHLGSVASWLGGLALLFLVVLRGTPDELAAHVAKDLSAAGASSPPDQRDATTAGEEDPGAAQREASVGQQAVEGLANIVQRFSTLAAAAVVVIVITGTFLGWRQSRSWGGLTDTTYGRLLLTKVALVAVVLAGAAVSRSVVRRWADRPGRSVGALRRSVGIEALVAGGVLAITAALVNTVPAKDAVADSVFEAEVHGNHVLVQLTVDPAEVGLVDLRVETLTHGGEPTDVEELEVLLSLPEESISNLPVELESVGTGDYEATGTEILFPGTWQLQIVARTSEIDVDRLSVDVPVR